MIRQAHASEAQQIAPLIEQASHEIAETLTGTTDKEAVLERLAYFVSQTRNRLSHENTLVKIIKDEVAGIGIAYAGTEAKQLDGPFKEQLKQWTGQDVQIDVETEEPVYYLDTLSVDARHGGKGIGTELLQAAAEVGEKQGLQAFRLNADQTIVGAQRLYRRLGFKPVRKFEISGGTFDYMERRYDIQQ
jgi:ribosomal protein S18 acetylase RimI-like enzyme